MGAPNPSPSPSPSPTPSPNPNPDPNPNQVPLADLADLADDLTDDLGADLADPADLGPGEAGAAELATALTSQIVVVNYP